MRRGDVEELFRRHPVVLLSGPVETRLAHEFGRASPGNASFVQLFDDDGRPALASIYESYMRVAGEHDLPIVVDTPTWRAHPDGVTLRGFDRVGLRLINLQAVDLLQALRKDLGLERLVMIAGVVGPRYDGYDPHGAPDASAARDYHRAQIGVLAEAGVDLLYAPTFPAAGELEGVALACAMTGLPYILAPVIDRNGLLPDGCPIAELVARIDAVARPAPLLFAGGCVHASDFRAAMELPGWPALARVSGIAANGSALPRSVLAQLDHDESDAPRAFAEQVFGLRRRGLRLLGGCCGTNHDHLRALARCCAAAEGLGEA